jgi:hypothetical protein
MLVASCCSQQSITIFISNNAFNLITFFRLIVGPGRSADPIIKLNSLLTETDNLSTKWHGSLIESR